MGVCVCAVMAHRRSGSDPYRAEVLGIVSIILSIVGIVISIIVFVVVYTQCVS